MYDFAKVYLTQSISVTLLSARLEGVSCDEMQDVLVDLEDKLESCVLIHGQVHCSIHKVIVSYRQGSTHMKFKHSSMEVAGRTS